ncbi:MAG: GNAT family N-acetyltransferase [Rhodobacteraceae bacterium]|nr:GNAT family N-acetyltransferase [Paracoccaceae bacterium]
MNRTIPILNTGRVTLRAMLPGEFDRYAEIWATPEVVRHIGGVPRSRAEAWSAFLRNAGHWQMTGFGQWAIADQTTRRMIGQVGFFYSDQTHGPDFDSFPEAGWVLAQEAQGRGLGTEAVRAAHEWFDRVIPGPLGARIAADNTASQAIAARMGYRKLREIEQPGGTLCLLRRDGPPGRR